jgi:hypothetical protein
VQPQRDLAGPSPEAVALRVVNSADVQRALERLGYHLLPANAPYDPLRTEAGEVVRQRPGLTAEDKLAWAFLWLCSREGRELARVTPGDIGGDQGVSETAARRRKTSLRREGLIQIVDERAGVWTIRVYDPRDVYGAVRTITGDPQRELFNNEPTDANRPLSESHGDARGDAPCRLAIVDDAATDPPAEASADPLAEASCLLSGPLGQSAPSVQEKISLRNHEPSITPSVPSTGVASAKDQSRGRSVGGTAADNDLPELHRSIAQRRAEQRLPSRDPGDRLSARYVASLAAAMVNHVPDPRVEAQTRERWIDVIRRRVDDPQLKTIVMVKVATAVAAKQITPDDVEGIFAALDNARRAKTLRGPPGKYFLCAAREVFRRHGLEWLKQPRSREPRDKPP